MDIETANKILYSYYGHDYDGDYKLIAIKKFKIKRVGFYGEMENVMGKEVTGYKNSDDRFFVFGAELKRIGASPTKFDNDFPYFFSSRELEELQ